MNALSRIAQAVKTELDAATFAPLTPASIERVYVPRYDPVDDNSLKLLVIGLDEAIDLNGDIATRDANEHNYVVKVAVMKRVTAGDVTSTAALAELDGLSDFREQVIDYLKTKRQLTAYDDANLVGLTNAPVYDPAQLEQNGVFTSVITLTYMLLR